MTKFLVLYISPISSAQMMAGATPEQAQAGMDAWMAWAQKNGDAVVDLGVPLGSSKRIVTGLVSAGSTHVSGYSVIEAESLDAATAMLEDHPHLHTPGGAVEVLESLPMPGPAPSGA